MVAVIDILEVPATGAVADVTEQGLIFPIPGAQKNTVVFEPRDGEAIQSLTAKALDFKVGNRTMLRVRKVRIDFFITDARLAVACSKYDKGGGWVGGATAMVVFNSVSKARAKLRSRGKMLAGQVRYPWLRWVASTPKTGFSSEETLVLHSSAEDGTAMTLTLTLPKNIEASRVAAEIAARAARYRLSSEELDAEARARIEAHLGGQSRAASGEKQVFEMAAPLPVSEHSARIAPQADLLPAREATASEPVPTPPSPPSLEAAAFCTACGEGIGAEDAFCSACGERVET
ncbi:MAG TPA: zinc ribbon domain-containing protein [Solirubrobacterales bacterium]|nr:zinc ribbon domain-containing protein [Solirubrobacterales bacterium]